MGWPEQERDASEGRPDQAVELEPPASAKRLSTLERVDYSDAFRLETLSRDQRGAEEWARAVLEGVPFFTRERLRQAWLERGVELGPIDDERFVLWWQVGVSRPEYALLEVGTLASRTQLLFECGSGTLLVATLHAAGFPSGSPELGADRAISPQGSAPAHRAAGQRAISGSAAGEVCLINLEYQRI
jgi:hypothetical protein